MTPFERRTRAAQDRLDPGEGLVLVPGPNLYYLTGFDTDQSERHFFYLVGSTGEPTLILPELYAEQVEATTWVKDIRSYSDEEDPLELVRTTVDRIGLLEGTLRVDPSMWTQFSIELRQSLPQASIVLADTVLTELRIRKDETELEALQEAATVADRVSQEIRALGETVVGWTEAELAEEIEDRLSNHGASELAFPVIVGSGPNGAQPHHTHGDRVIEAGDPVVLDFGGRIDHYPGDQTRTIVFAGDPQGPFKTAFEAVRTAQEAAIDAAKPGVTTGEVDAAARDILTDRGYGEAFIHRTGHGVGLSVHEAPYIVEDGTRELTEGMVFSIEPGVYLSGEFGIRIEDLVVVTDDGVDRLNSSPRDWRPTPESNS